MPTFPTANPGAELPAKEPGVHRWIMVASYTLSAQEAADAAIGVPVVMDLAHLFTTPEVGCLDCEGRYAETWTGPCPAGDEWSDLEESPATVAPDDLSDDERDALLAGVDVIGRSGAKDFEFGFLDDNPANPRWWAKAQYGGARLGVEGYRSPTAAIESLVRRVLTGGLCTHCGRYVKVGGAGGKACRWYRDGRTWRRGCEAR